MQHFIEHELAVDHELTATGTTEGPGWKVTGLEGLSLACNTGLNVLIHQHERSFEVMSTFISPPRPKIVYPCGDGQPIAENTLQFRWIVTIEGGLERSSSTIPTSSWPAISSGIPSREVPISAPHPM